MQRIQRRIEVFYAKRANQRPLTPAEIANNRNRIPEEVGRGCYCAAKREESREIRRMHIFESIVFSVFQLLFLSQFQW